MIDYMTSNLRLDCLKLALSNSDYNKRSSEDVINEAATFFNFIAKNSCEKTKPTDTKDKSTSNPRCQTNSSSWEIFTKSLDECFKNAPKEIQPFINPFNYK